VVRRVLTLIFACLLAAVALIQTLPTSALFGDVVWSSNGGVARPALISARLDRDHPKLELDGIELFLPQELLDQNVIVTIHCIDKQATPPPKIDSSYYGADATLINLTAQSASGCGSYDVTAIRADPPQALTATTISTRDTSTLPATIAVGMHLPAVHADGTDGVEQGIFVFNPVTGDWTSANQYSSNSQPSGGGKSTHVFATLNESVQRIIGGVITVPKPFDARPAATDPSALSQPLSQVNPLNGYLSIDGIVPDNKGSYSIDLPLLLRPARGPGPSFAITYSPNGGVGVLGRGWDLRVSTIEARGPAPVYHPDYETEDYTLDGMDLIAMDGQGKDITPLYKGGPIMPRVSDVRYFHLRDASSGLIVRRYGNDPGLYFWEVWDPNSHVTRLYGGTYSGEKSRPELSENDNGLLRGNVVTASGFSRQVIGQWALTEEYDSQKARNGAVYEYVRKGTKKEICAAAKDCQFALLLSRVTYNLSLSEPESAPREGRTIVDFAWNERNNARISSDGHLGFFRVQSHWLRSITVHYAGAPSLLTSFAGEVDNNTDLDGNKGDNRAETLFARHSFVLNETGDEEWLDACLNDEVVLKSYEVEANARYDADGSSGLPKQVFVFGYDGERHSATTVASDPSEVCQLPQKEWKASIFGGNQLAGVPAKIEGTLGFPAGLIDGLGLGLLSSQSILGTSQDRQIGGSFYAGGGPPGNSSLKDWTGGIKVGASSSRSEGGTSLADVTGDGIADIVFRQNQALHYCAGVRNAIGDVSYPLERCGEIEGVTEFSRSSSSTRSTSFEGFGPAGIMGGIGYNTTRNQLQVYLTDRDGDGLVDVAADGRIFYGQGETMRPNGSHVVRFLPDSALLPPVPGIAASLSDLSGAHLPKDLRTTIAEIETQLTGMSAALNRFDASETTIVWEAPLDGRITLAGIFTLAATPPDPKAKYIDYGEFGPAGSQYSGETFGTVEADARKFNGHYVKLKQNCALWPEGRHCHELASDPNGPNYSVPPANIEFIATPVPQIQVSLAHRGGDVKTEAKICARSAIAEPTFDLSSLSFSSDCRLPETPQVEIDVAMGDVVYVTYTVGPHTASFARPDLHVVYTEVKNDVAFALTKAGDPEGVAAALPCKWAEQAQAALSDCLLSRQNMYGYDLTAGTLTSAPSQAVVLPPATERRLTAKFILPTDLTRDYAVYFDVAAATVPNFPYPASASHPIVVPAALGPELFPASSLGIAFSEDVSALCTSEAGPDCTVSVDACADAAAASCPVLGDLDTAVEIAIRLRLEHRDPNGGALSNLPVRNLDSQLSAFRWLEAPTVSTIPVQPPVAAKDAARPPVAMQPILLYLPVAMGTPDIVHVRVETGVVDNPDLGLHDDLPGPNDKVDLAHMLELERASEVLARTRQTLALCGYAEELIAFLRLRSASPSLPFPGDVVTASAQEFDTHRSRCLKARKDFDDAKFTGTDSRPETNFPYSSEVLRLKQMLRRLPVEEQLTSAQTLFDRVLVMLNLGPDLLMDDARLTRRGYRLPAKVNPFDCADITPDFTPLVSSVVGTSAGPCAYRLSTNFAMQDYREALPGDEAENVERIFAGLRGTTTPAFRIEMTATANGAPIAFRRLSGADTGNDECPTSTTSSTCIGSYGTIGPEAYFHPLGESPLLGPLVVYSKPVPETGDSEPVPRLKMNAGVPIFHGDVFQRITANKRTGRAVAFQNSIMDDRVKAICEGPFAPYDGNLASMEAKQDCSFPGHEVAEEQKYEGDPVYRIDYEVGEDNQFVGRNWVLEFQARPFDVLELHYRVVPVEQVMEFAPGKTLHGAFSLVDLPPGPKAKPHTYVIPRSPAHILPGSRSIDCPTLMPAIGSNPASISGILTEDCRPFTQLAWTEVFLGAEYRTFNDAQKTDVDGQFSIKRRRDLMRLQPELEVAAEKYHLEQLDASAPEKKFELKTLDYWITKAVNQDQKILSFIKNYSKLDTSVAAPHQHLLYFSRDPAVSKTGGQWAFIAGRVDSGFFAGDALRIPSFDTLRFWPTLPDVKPQDLDLVRLSKPCGTPNRVLHPSACNDQFAGLDNGVASLDGVQFFGLMHHFTGPASANGAGLAPISGTCVSQMPLAVASCWTGMDDTVALERRVADTSTLAPLTSVSALIGLERPPVVAFLDAFQSYKKLACLDPAMPDGICPELRDAATLVQFSVEGAYPNRPAPAASDRVLKVYAPIQTSSGDSVTANGGIDRLHTNFASAQRRSGTFLQDVNGDGYPDVVSGGIAQLSSPVGVARSDWWRYFRTDGPKASLGALQSGSGFATSLRSISAGVGASPATAGVSRDAGKAYSTGSHDARVNSDVSFNLDHGQDLSSTQLIDLNGDGIADSVFIQSGNGGEIGAVLSSGNRLRSASTGFFPSGASAVPVFGATGSFGLGINLGFSGSADSFGGGTGVQVRHSGTSAILADFTGDGRPDLVQPDGAKLLVFPNLGNGFAKQPMSFNIGGATSDGLATSETTLVDSGGFFTYGFSTWFAKFVFTVAGQASTTETREIIGLRDMNGDGVPDIATVSGLGRLSDLGGEPTTTIRYNPVAKSHLLASIRNPAGSRIELKYGLFGNSGPEHGAPVWALTEVARFDGFDTEALIGATAPKLPSDGQDVLLATYSYSDGFFNRAERLFYGFAHRTTVYYGCDGAINCMNSNYFASNDDAGLLRSAGYLPLQRIDEDFANGDFYTQGTLLRRTISGIASAANGSEGLTTWTIVSRQRFGYSIDNLSTTIAPAAFGSNLAELWSTGQSQPTTAVLGSAGAICETDIETCAAKLTTRLRQTGFEREQHQFWGQQSAAVRQRFVGLEIFGGGTATNFECSNPPYLFGAGSDAAEECNGPDDPTATRLQSAVGYDTDQWGQILAFDDIGEASSGWIPVDASSLNARIAYVPLQGGSIGIPKASGYPLLGLASEITIFGGPWPGASSTPLRAREAIYNNDGRGNVADVCLFPGGEGFEYNTGMCAQFRDTLSSSLKSGYDSLQSALRTAYAKTDGLPKGESVFKAIVLQQIVTYDDFGNITHTVSPLSANKEWIERRFSYGADPFRRIATTTELTRCIENVPGSGANSALLAEFHTPACTFGLATLPVPILRAAISHSSFAAVDPHFGNVSRSSDINGNSLLFDFDRWGRLALIGRSWGVEPRENRVKRVAEMLELAVAKLSDAAIAEMPPVDNWKALALVDYSPGRAPLKDNEASRENVPLRSSVLRFESSNAYAGLLGGDKTTRETTLFTDGLGLTVQSVREADVCTEPLEGLNGAGSVSDAAADVEERCKSTFTAIVSPGGAIDALGRDWAAFQSYAAAPAVAKSGTVRFKELIPTTQPEVFDPIRTTSFDGAGRPILVESRLSTDVPLRGASQFAYSVVTEKQDRAARFEVLTLSPRCTLSATWSDARGLVRYTLEDQLQFHAAASKSFQPPATADAAYGRDYDLAAICRPIAELKADWSTATAAAEKGESQPARVTYSYDPLGQLTGVEYPLDDMARGAIALRYDLLGRNTELNDPDSGCSAYDYDGLNNLVSLFAFKHEASDAPCGTSSKVSNQKIYAYSADRLLGITYRSLDEQGGSTDIADSVRFYYDRYPYAPEFGQVFDTPRFIPNDLANQRFVDVTGRKCDNCIGLVALVTDRSGARSFRYDELGLSTREIRSIVGPSGFPDVRDNGGGSEVYQPEIAFYEQNNTYTAFGDPLQQQFDESEPINPANSCIIDPAGVSSCLAHFSIGWKYAPDGAVAEQLFNGRALVFAAQDALGRPAIRWTADGIVSAYHYDPLDLRANQVTTQTAGGVPVLVDSYQYDGGGNILGYVNDATHVENYASSAAFDYDAANRLTRFETEVSKGGMGALMSAANYDYDAGHRMTSRRLTIADAAVAGHAFDRIWRYDYADDPALGPVHAPQSVLFRIGDTSGRLSAFTYDDLGRMTGIVSDTEAQQSIPVLSNRAITWDAEGRPIRVRGVADAAVPENEIWLSEDYVYDFGGNRTLKIDQPRNADGTQVEDADGELVQAAFIYMTSFYARPYDRRGTVELSQSSLPSASLTPPVNPGENPRVTWLYSDLPVGSMTAGVTLFGEPDNVEATKIARREYEPYGLELTNDALAQTGRDGLPPLDAFQGKEFDRVTGFSSFGARSYSRDLGIWLSPDPIASILQTTPTSAKKLASFGFANALPTMLFDAEGLDAKLASGAPNESVYRRIEYMAPYIIEAAKNHPQVGAIDMAAIVYQEKKFGIWADLKDVAGAAYSYVRKDWGETSLGPAEMKLKLVAEISGLNVNDHNDRGVIWALANKVPSAMELLAKNIEKNQEALSMSLTPQGAGTAHNRGIEGFKRNNGMPSEVSSRITDDVLRNLQMILDYAK
jgi:RHS repeat-associated protein